MSILPVGSFRRQKIIINRLRIGCISITHRHVMTKEEPTIYNTFGIQITVKHIFTKCHNHQKNREKILCTILYEILSPDSKAIYNLINHVKKIQNFQ